jgi:hypothetical protein
VNWRIICALGILSLAGALQAQSAAPAPTPASAGAESSPSPVAIVDPDAEAFAAKVNPRYYSLTEAGFKSLTCTARLDWIGLPSESLAALPKNIVSRLKESSIEITMPLHGAVSVRKIYPVGLSAFEKSEDDPALNVLADYLSGFFTTWPTITAAGPLPSPALITKIQHDGDASRVFLNKPDVELVFDDAGTLTEIIIRLPNREIDQHPKFADTNGRLIIQSNDVTDKSGDAVSAIHTDETYQAVDGVEIPASVHITARGTDASFTLHDCSVQKVNAAPTP